MTRSTVGWLLVGIQVLLFLVLILLPWRSPTVVLAIVGGALVVAALLLGLSAGRSLGRALTPTPVPISGAGLRTDGPYRLVRHPIYSALLLGTLGYLIALGSGWSWAWGAVILGFFWGKSRWEDTLLREEYDGEWSEWSATTGALVPRLHRRSTTS